VIAAGYAVAFAEDGGYVGYQLLDEVIYCLLGFGCPI